jgi:hypothetical protein
MIAGPKVLESRHPESHERQLSIRIQTIAKNILQSNLIALTIDEKLSLKAPLCYPAGNENKKRF